MRLLWSLALLAGCNLGLGSRLQMRVAIGWESKLTDGGSFLGPRNCDPSRITGDDVFVRVGDSWRAARPGQAIVPCRDGTLEVTVSTVATYRLEGAPTIGVGDQGVARLVGLDLSGDRLDLGPVAIEWALAGALAPIGRNKSECMDPNPFLLLRSEPRTLSFGARETGVGWVIARVDGKSYELAVTAL